MMAQNMRKGISIAHEAIQNTGKGERALYVLLVSVGALLVILGWRADVQGWAAGNPYFLGLLDGATGFCFGVPVAGVVIREIARRANRSAERRTTVRSVIAQLDYLTRLAEQLAPGQLQSVSDRLRQLAETTRLAMPGASAIAAEAYTGMILSTAKMAVLPKVEKKYASQLRSVVESDRLWTLVGFSGSRLAIDVSRLVTALYSPAALQPGFPPWLDELISAVHTLQKIQLPVHRNWLSAALKDPPTVVSVAAWGWTQQPEKKSSFLVSIQRADQPSDAKERKRLLQAAQDRATSELKDELRDLAHHLDALAGLGDAAVTCHSQLELIEDH